MQRTDKIINFRWERFKHTIKKIVANIKKYIENIFGRSSKSSLNKNAKKNVKSYNKKRKTKKFKY